MNCKFNALYAVVLKSIAVLLLVVGGVHAQERVTISGYLHDTTGDLVRSTSGNCVHTSSWTPELATVPGCDGVGDAVVSRRDRDGDGVIFGIDTCPNTPAGATVDRVGCPKDTDKDSIYDGIDQCPNTIGGALVDQSGCAIRLSGTNFGFDSAELEASAQRILDEAAARLKQAPGVNIAIDGYTDNRGDPNYNQDLSRRRAQAAKDYLVSKGVSGSRISVAGFGERLPIADNETSQGRAQNRRVVLRVVDR